MTTELVASDSDMRRQVALLKAVGLDRLAPEQRELALHIAERYELDLMLKHLVMIEGRPYITRDGLLHVAHRSGKFDGIETSEPKIVDGFWRSTCSVWRKDMTHPFTYTGRYPTSGGNQKFAPEMAVKVGEVMSLRRAFDVAAPVFEERWDVEVPPAEEPKPVPTLRDRVAAKAAETRPLAAVQIARENEGTNGPSSVEQAAEEAGVATQDYLEAAHERIESTGKCEAPSPYGEDQPCNLPAGHGGNYHRLLDEHGKVTASWPR